MKWCGTHMRMHTECLWPDGGIRIACPVCHAEWIESVEGIPTLEEFRE